jgi:hypothetical protein
MRLRSTTGVAPWLGNPWVASESHLHPCVTRGVAATSSHRAASIDSLIYKERRPAFLCRPYLNNPHTAVWGISGSFRTASAVGGIRPFDTVSAVGGLRFRMP